jgi:Rieske Fe-S protein
MYDPYHYYRTQWVNQKPYLIAGGEDHKTGKESNTESSFLRLISHVRNYFQVSKISYQWSSQYFESVDGLPYIGKLPGSKDEQIYVATGYGGNGMVYSTIAARIISSMITESHELSYQNIFNPARIKPIAGFKEFIKHNTDVAKELLHKWIPAEKLNNVVDLSPGEGQIVKFEGEEIALAKDHDGRLHAVSPKCAHMKCNVQWNLAEQTWDCPCHGARYQPDGKMITGPATSDLMPIELRALIERK